MAGVDKSFGLLKDCIFELLDQFEEKITQKSNPVCETITLTFGDCGENHVGMQKIGKLAEKGFSIDQLRQFRKSIQEIDPDAKCELINLSIDETNDKAAVLIVRGGIDILLRQKKHSSNDLFKEQQKLEWDSKAKMYGRVVEKHARHNLCYDEKAQEPDYMNGKGRIVAFDKIPITNILKKNLEKLLNSKLIGEGNRYFDPSTCGIGFHGDSERKKVIGCRLGADMCLHYQWFLRSEPVGPRFRLTLRNGDLYIMSEKAVGFDWKLGKIYTLRHAAGCEKFTTIKKNGGRRIAIKK